jgi:hypothetical protein
MMMSLIRLQRKLQKMLLIQYFLYKVWLFFVVCDIICVLGGMNNIN